MRKTLGAIALGTALLAGASGALVGCGNETTPAGHEGYVYHKPLIIGHQKYVGSQKGPDSTGLSWRLYVTNIDMRPKTYSESYHILSRDNLNLSFQSHAKVSLKPGSVKDVVEQFGSRSWFKNNVQQQYRAAVREVVRQYNAYDVKGKSKPIAAEILTRLQKQFEKTPVNFRSMSIGNIDYPKSVNVEIERKLAAQQKLQRMGIEERIAERQARVRIKKAEGLAKAQNIIRKTLTPLYVQHEAIEAYKQLANSPNTTFIIAPTSPNGTGMPLILNAKK